MPSEPAKFVPTSYPSPNRLWAEQLAMGLALLFGLLVFMAIFHPKMLSAGAQVLGPNDMNAFGLVYPLGGIILQVAVHELGTVIAAWRMKLPLRLRFFGFGANATATLEDLPRDVWRDAVVGLSGPAAGTALAILLSGIYEYTKYQDVSMHVGNPYFLGMACVGYFYNLFTLIPILDLEGGWIAPAIAPQAWLIGLIAMALEITSAFNLVLLGVVCFTVPRFVLLLRARMPRTDNACNGRQRVMISLAYFGMILFLAWFSSTTFDRMPNLVRAYFGD